jgi:hypothetical protein
MDGRIEDAREQAKAALKALGISSNLSSIEDINQAQQNVRDNQGDKVHKNAAGKPLSALKHLMLTQQALSSSGSALELATVFEDNTQPPEVKRVMTMQAYKRVLEDINSGGKNNFTMGDIFSNNPELQKNLTFKLFNSTITAVKGLPQLPDLATAASQGFIQSLRSGNNMPKPLVESIFSQLSKMKGTNVVETKGETHEQTLQRLANKDSGFMSRNLYKLSDMADILTNPKILGENNTISKEDREAAEAEAKGLSQATRTTGDMTEDIWENLFLTISEPLQSMFGWMQKLHFGKEGAVTEQTKKSLETFLPRIDSTIKKNEEIYDP